jgi:Cof subfamily protein (haloacid dehalogenase superfamily)
MNRIIFCDIDGTLIDGFRGMMDASDRTMYALRELQKTFYVIFTSGRAKCMLPGRLASFAADGYILSSGAYIECGGKVLRDHAFTKGQIEKIRDYSHRTDGHYILVNQHALYSDTPEDRMVCELLRNLGISRKLLHEDTHEESVNFMIEICRDETRCGAFSKAFDYQFSIKRQYTYTAYDVNRLGDNKGDAVSMLMKFLKIPEKESYCFGDSDNDLEMMAMVQHSVSMGNAGAHIRKSAERVTEDVLQDGFYHELVRQHLIKPEEGI